MKPPLRRVMEDLSRYSAGVSIALHLLFFALAHTMVVARHNPPPPKVYKYKLTYVAPKPPPPQVKKEIEKKTEPQALPVTKVEKQPVRQPAEPVRAVEPVRTTATVAVSEALPMMTAATVPLSEALPMGMARVQRTVSRVVEATDMAPRSIQTADAAQNTGHVGTVARVSTSGARRVSFPSDVAPRPAPEITFDPKILKNYLGIIQSKIERAKEYPDVARRAGIQGKVKVQFTVLKDGRIENPVLIEEGPHRVLNAEALAAIQRAAPFDRLPDEIGKDSLNVILPFSFMLN